MNSGNLILYQSLKVWLYFDIMMSKLPESINQSNLDFKYEKWYWERPGGCGCSFFYHIFHIPWIWQIAFQHGCPVWTSLNCGVVRRQSVILILTEVAACYGLLFLSCRNYSPYTHLVSLGEDLNPASRYFYRAMKFIDCSLNW